MELDVVQVIVVFRLVVRLEFRKVRVHPDPHSSLLVEENHLFCDFEDSDLLIEYFESVKAGLIKIELILQRDIIDFL